MKDQIWCDHVKMLQRDMHHRSAALLRHPHPRHHVYVFRHFCPFFGIESFNT